MSKQKKQKTDLRRTHEMKIDNVVERFTPSIQDNRIFKERLNYSFQVNSNVGGVINTVLGMDPSFAAEWSTYASLYDSFRVIGVRIRLVSKQQYSLTVANDSVVIAYDDNNVSALTSLDGGLQYNTSHVFSAVWSHVATGTSNYTGVLDFSFLRPTAGRKTPIDWIPTSTPGGSLGAVKFYATNLAISTTYMIASADWYVEFRGRN